MLRLRTTRASKRRKYGISNEREAPEGLLSCDTHRGFTVVAADLGRVEENFRIRAALESLGASLAARKVGPAGMGADPVKEVSG